MNDLQARALLECEYRYYQVAVPYIFEGYKTTLGYETWPPASKLTDVEIKALNGRIRKVMYLIATKPVLA